MEFVKQHFKLMFSWILQQFLIISKKGNFLSNVFLSIKYFSRWGDYDLSRPNNDQHFSRLVKRLRNFLSEAFVETRPSHDGWTVILEKII